MVDDDYHDEDEYDHEEEEEENHDHDEIVPMSSPHSFLEESESQDIEVLKLEEKVHLVPVRHDQDGCDEKDISSPRY